MDSDRGYALAPAAKKFETEFGIKVTIESPEKITDSFSIAAQAGKGPDIVIWAHDKLGEWADGGLIAPLELSKEFLNKFCPKAWQAVLHDDWIWGYPISLETETLIYNKKLLEGSVPRCLVWVIAKLTHVWDIQIKLTGSMVGCGSEVDEVSKATSHSFC
jgi:maltose/maltodextrin transport system substrate-binding protein